MAASKPRRLWQLPTFVLGLAAVWAAATYVSPPADASARVSTKLDDLAAALERKPLAIGEVESLVKLLAESPGQTPRSHFLLGTAYVTLASQKPTEMPDAWKLAIQHFDACEPGSLSPEDTSRMAFRMAKAQAAVGRGEPQALIAALMNAPPGEDKAECPRLIAECALRLPKPDLARARDELTTYLGGQHRAGAAADRYKLLLADLNAKLGDGERSRRWLRDISNSAPADVLARSKSMLAKQAFAEKNWAEAVTHYEAMLAIPGVNAADKGAIRYQLGEANLKLGDLSKAKTFYEDATREQNLIGGQAALRLAELETNPDAAIDWLERAAALIDDDAVRQSSLPVVIALVARSVNGGDFINARRAAVAKAKFTGASEALQIAKIDAEWGLMLRAANDPKASEKLKAAADGYVNAGAMINALPLYVTIGDSKTALDLTTKLLDTKLEPAAIASVNITRAGLLPASDFNGIKTALETAMNQPSPLAMTARMKLGLLHVNRAQEILAAAHGSIHPDAAKKEAESTASFGRDLLKQVADATTVPPESRTVHEQAIFELGRLLLRDGKYTDAEARFKNQLVLYPLGSFAGYGRLWLVCSLLQQARTIDNPKKLLEEALSYLKPLTQSNDPYLRTYGEIWTANALLELGDAAAVVPMGKEMMTRYRGKPEELVAGKLLFYAYLKIAAPEPAEASRTLDRMDEAFAALPKTSFPNDPEYSQERWKTELPKMREELRKHSP